MLMLIRGQRQATGSSSSITTIRGGSGGGAGCGGMVGMVSNHRISIILIMIRRTIYWCQSTRRHEMSIYTALATLDLAPLANLALALDAVVAVVLISCIEEEGGGSDGNFVGFRLHLQQPGHTSAIQGEDQWG